MVIYFYLGALLELAAKNAITYVTGYLAREGLEIRDPDFESVGLSLPPSLFIKHFSAHMVITQHNVFQIDRNFSLTIDKMVLSVDNVMKKTFFFTFSGCIVRLQPERGMASSYGSDAKADECDRMEIELLQVPLTLNYLNLKEMLTTVQSTVKAMAKFAKFGVTDLPIALEGASAFVVREKPVKGRLILVPYESGYKMVMDREDFRAIASVLGERLTEVEFDVYCNNPLRMPRLLRIRNYASDKSREAAKAYPATPEEAYKHILWAYHLLRAYDEKFSAEVTDAHEINPIGRSEYAVRTYLREEHGEEKTPTERIDDVKKLSEVQMDLTNNFIGREYAKKGFTETSLLGRTLADPRVIRDYREIERNEKEPIVKLPDQLL